jgi:hypothetical protein
MDTGNGLFAQLEADNKEKALAALEKFRAENPNHGGTFYVGQNLEINGSKFRVLAITKKTMTLRLLPK